MTEQTSKTSVKTLPQARQMALMSDCLKALHQKSAEEPVTIEDIAAAVDVLHETGVSEANILLFLEKLNWRHDDER